LLGASDPLKILVVSFDGPVPVGGLAHAVASIAGGGGRIHSLSDDEFLLVGNDHEIRDALSLLGQVLADHLLARSPPSGSARAAARSSGRS
jgi:hypothetical protein